AKDVLLVVDDFAPHGPQTDVQRLHAAADRVLRGQGNNAGRLRMRADATLRPAKPPRGLILSTGEDVPAGQSLRARMLVLALAAGALAWGPLTQLQEAAAAGQHAAALAGFVHWMAPQYEEFCGQVRRLTSELRARASQNAQHKRTPALVAELALGLDSFLTYAAESGAITQDERDAMWARGWRALGVADSAQME